MTRLIEHAAGRKVLLILDNLRVHHARVLQPWLREHRYIIELFFIPSCSPHLHPDELLNHDLEANAVGRERARNKDELVENVTSLLEARAATPPIVANVFKERHVSDAA